MKKILAGLGRIIILFLLVSAVLLTPWSYSISFPGACFSLKGKVRTPFAAQNRPGELFITTVYYERANLLLFCLAQLNPPYELLPLSREEKQELGHYDSFMRADMRQSQFFAKLAALKYLGYKVTMTPVGVKILEVLPVSRAKGKLRPGDIILEAQGKRVDSLPELIARLQKAPLDRELELTLKREKNLTLKVPLSTIRGRKVLGIYGETIYQLGKMPFKITIDSLGISGSSAGLMYALEIIRQAGKTPLTHQKVAGTGTISPSGRVGEILGVEYKIKTAQKAGVRIFLLPTENYRELGRKNLGLRLLPVDNLSQAVKALKMVDK